MWNARKYIHVRYLNAGTLDSREQGKVLDWKDTGEISYVKIVVHKT